MPSSAEKVYLYEKIIRKLVDYIVHSGLSIGDAIPPERELAQMFECNYHTVRKAIQVMIERSLLERQQGRGTFIRSAMTHVTTGPAPRVAFRQTNLLGVIIPASGSQFASQLMLNFFDAARREGYELVVTPVETFDAASLLIPDRLQSQGCQAIIVLHNRDNIERGYLAEFVRMCTVPVVLAQRIPGFEELCYDCADNFGVTACEEVIFACNYFNSQDFDNIAMLIPHFGEQPQVTNIKAGVYYEKMLSFGLKPNILQAASDFSNIPELVAGLAAQKGRKAVICYDDNYALHLMMAVLLAGYRVPEDFAILGCNGDEEYATLPIALSTIRFPYQYLAHALLDKARSRMGQEVSPRELPIVLPVIRASCGGRVHFKDELDTVLQNLIGSIRFESKNIVRKHQP